MRFRDILSFYHSVLTLVLVSVSAETVEEIFSVIQMNVYAAVR